jgi:predicted transcriptional regulator
MTVQTATLTEYHKLSPDMTVEEGLNVLHDKKIRILPVVDDENNYLGMFCYRTLLGKLLPFSAMMEGGLESLNFTSQTNEEVREKLEGLLDKKVVEVMDEERPTLTTDMSFWHMLLMIYKYDAPLAVLDKDTNKMFGVVTKQSSIEDLKRRVPQL